jgi:hypothetical protein
VRAERERERDEEGEGKGRGGGGGGGGGQQYGQLEARAGLPAFRYMLWPPVTGRARRRRDRARAAELAM